MKTIARLLPVLTACALAAPALAQDDEFAAGRGEYLAACAACHGENADGNGPIGTMFTTPIPDLRKITARNDGVFPTLKIFMIVDGRTGIKAHGDPMPLFGNRYEAEVGESGGPFGSEQLVRARVLELVYYLESIQE
ncbi:MAG: cytochrome c [Paracoccaceae bacterium]|nr:cytochrome c [Paracoccaceae bacterium]